MGPPPETRQLEKPLGFCVSHRSAERDIPGIAASGAGWVRLDFKWDKIEPESGLPDFTDYDELVAQAEREDLKIIGVLLYDAPWIHREGKIRKYIPPSRIPDYCRFIEQVALRYGDRIAVWEIWNEPNTLHWTGPVNHFFRLFASTVETLENTLDDPYITTPGIFWGDTAFLKKMFRSVPMDKVDAISFHPYATTPEGSARQMIKVIESAGRLGYTGDFWISEIGYPTGGLYPSRISERRMGDAVIKTLGYALRLGISGITWYKFSDSLPRKVWNSENWFGLTQRDHPEADGSGIRAFRFMTGYVNGSVINPLSVENRGVPELFLLGLTGDSGSMVLFWGKKGTELQIEAPEGTLMGNSGNMDNPRPLPPGGVIKLTGLAEFLLVPDETPVVFSQPGGPGGNRSY
jgi:hypothetical protein